MSLLILPATVGAQQAMANGQNHVGAISAPGEIDTYTFSATAGDVIGLAIGEIGAGLDFSPWIRVFDPSAVQVSSASGPLAAQLELVAAATGTFSVQVASNDPGFDGTGDYTLTLANGSAAFTISPGDEGGTMTNGDNHTGVIHVGDIDMWSFTANAGEALIITIGETGGNTEFAPWIRLRGPAGQAFSVQGPQAAGINVLNAAATGTYTVVVASADIDFDAAGTYTLTIANSLTPFVVPPGDQGGPIVIGDPTPGSIHIGDLDTWSFFAHATDPLTITVTDLNSPGTVFSPFIRLRSPTGTNVGVAFNAMTATINIVAPATGLYTVVVASGDSGFSGFGDYVITVSGTTNTMIRNGDFSNGETFWQFFATPTSASIVHEVTNGVLEYYRVPPAPGTTNQAVAFQTTGVSLPAGAPVLAQFDLGNSSSVRKRIAVLVLDTSFADLSVCTFWLEPNAPMRTYQIRSHTNQAWSDTALYFYAATAGESGGRYQIDNVSMRYAPEQADDRTGCFDPTAPAPTDGDPGPDLLVNGNFDTGSLAPWFTFGTITWQLTNGVFEFINPTGVAPAGVLAQFTGQPMPAGQILTATFRLGNTSGVRKRVTVLVHDRDFTDLSACTLWLNPGQPLSNYTYRTFATRPWTDAMLSVYPATVGAAQWIQLDDVTLRTTPGAISGTECIEPAASEAEVAGARSDVGPAARRGQRAVSAMGRAPLDAIPGGVAAGETALGANQASNFETIDLRDAATASLVFESLRHDASLSRALVQVSHDALTWTTLDVVPASGDWTTVRVDLSAFAGDVVRVRFALDGRSVTFDTPSVWRVRGLRVVIR